MEPPPLVSETLAAKRAAKAAATAAGAAGQLHQYHHHHQHHHQQHHHHQMHGLAGLARYNKGGCCGSLSPSGPLSPTSSLTSLQVRHTAWPLLVGLGAAQMATHSVSMLSHCPVPEMNWPPSSKQPSILNITSSSLSTC